MREIDVGTKRLLPQHLTLSVKGWLLEWWWSNREVGYSSIVSRLEFTTPTMERYSLGPLSVIHKNIDNVEEVKKARRKTKYNIIVLVN
jgi:hypothetical protein